MSYLVQLTVEIDEECQIIQTIAETPEEVCALIAHLPENVDIEEIQNMGCIHDCKLLLKDFIQARSNFDSDLELG